MSDLPARVCKVLEGMTLLDIEPKNWGKYDFYRKQFKERFDIELMVLHSGTKKRHSGLYWDFQVWLDGELMYVVHTDYDHLEMFLVGIRLGLKKNYKDCNCCMGDAGA